jgi:hypothetical protein
MSRSLRIALFLSLGAALVVPMVASTALAKRELRARAGTPQRDHGRRAEKLIGPMRGAHL